MNQTSLPIDRRIRVAGVLVILGLVVEAVTLVWNDPVSFLVYAFIGAALVGIGILYYLISLVTVRSART